MNTTYLIYISANFRKLEDADDFCSNYLVKNNKHLKEFRYVIQNLNTLMICFKSNKNPHLLSVDIGDTLISDNRVIFYYIIKKDDLIGYSMPTNISETLFYEDDLKSHYNNEFESGDFEKDENLLNAILDKIEQYGIDSLTQKEKFFLDKFSK